MSYDLIAVKPDAYDEKIGQGSWPAIWKWLNEKDGRLGPKAVRAGFFNDGHRVSAKTALRFARILRDNPVGGPAELDRDERRDRLIRFFEECGGFRIR